MYCRNCGKQIDDQAVVCVGCGVPPKKGSQFCQNCGKTTSPGADVCVSCGARLASAVSLSASDDKLMAVLAHILTIVAGFIPPLIIWLIKGKESSYVEEHSKESLNFQISLIIYWFGTFILSFVLIGFVIMPVLAIFALVVIILATIKDNNGEIYRYPLCIRLIK